MGIERSRCEGSLRLFEEIGERYGRWQDTECREMKNTLVKIETTGSVRVPLDRFYARGVDDANWQFLASVPYLGPFGGLDNADPQHMSDIILNYVDSLSNCFISLEFFLSAASIVWIHFSAYSKPASPHLSRLRR